MAKQKPGIPKGTRDFGPTETARREYIFRTIRNIFEHHGFLQIETPAMENLDTLLGKYGEEGDKLLFKILNSGDFLSSVDITDMRLNETNSLSLKIAEKGLRYDLTVPFARYVVQHRNEIDFPFKRYQIQPVWRADKPQKGRYREFYQCDADIIGSTSLLNEIDLLQIIADVFNKLNIRFRIKLNNRKILAGIAEHMGHPERLQDITIALDKLDKIGVKNVNDELRDKGISEKAIQKLQKVFLISEKDNRSKLVKLNEMLKESETGITGIEETEKILEFCREAAIDQLLEVDLSLARGLNYYTGTIIEVKATDVEIGSICGGGRYDDLTGIFGLKDVSGVGISFGADRIYDIMEQLNLFPEETIPSSRIMFVNFGEKESLYCLGLLKDLRSAGIASELYPDNAKLKKQLGYADARNIKWVAMAGADEIRESVITARNMVSGEQVKVTLDQLKELLLKV